MPLPPPEPASQDLIAGFCRFSYLGHSDWSAMRQNPDKSGLSAADWHQRAALLYADARLEARFAAFERICLPSILAQDDPRFMFWVITSPELPPRWLDRLAAACARSDAIRLRVMPQRQIEQGLSPILARLTRQAGRNLIQFRLDDDDALAIGAVGRMRHLAERMAGLREFGISIAGGLAVAIYPGRPVVPLRQEQPFLGASTAVCMADSGRSVFSIDHARVPRRMTHIVDREVPGSLALKWPSDSRPIDLDKLPNWLTPLTEAAFRAELASWFPWLAGFDFDELRRLVEATHTALTAPAGPGIHSGVAAGRGRPPVRDRPQAD